MEHLIGKVVTNSNWSTGSIMFVKKVVKHSTVHRASRLIGLGKSQSIPTLSVRTWSIYEEDLDEITILNKKIKYKLWLYL